MIGVKESMKKENERPYLVKDTFVLYRSYLAHLELLSNEDRGIWITAILHYVNDLPLPEMPPEVRMAFSFVKERLDEDYEKWQRKVASKRSAGAIGGIASGIARRSRAKAPASSASKTEANEHDNEYVYDNDNVYVNDHTSHVYDNRRKQTAKEARRGIERGTNYDAILLEQIRNRHAANASGSSDDVSSDPDIMKGR